MNFKTTITLLVMLVVVGVVVYFQSGEKPQDARIDQSNMGRLINAEAKDVTRLTVVAADGKELKLEKTKDQWRMTRPVDAAANKDEVDSLVGMIVGLKTRGQISPTDENAKAMGVDQPRWRVEIAAGDKRWDLAVGEKSAIGDTLYVRLNDNRLADMVPAELFDKLDRPANSLRELHLVNINSADLQRIAVTRPGDKLVLQKEGENWQIIEPENMPADPLMLDDLISAITGLRAGEFVSESRADTTKYQLAAPQYTVVLSTAAPATQPSTQPATTPTNLIINVGRYDDVLMKNVYVTVGDSPSIVKVPANLVESLGKKLLDLRHKSVVTIDPEKVSAITLQFESPATTQPTTRPASSREVRIVRRKAAVTVGPATAPVAPPTQWLVESAGRADADDAAVTAVLGDVSPLRAEKYLEYSPVTRPANRYVLTISTEGPGGTPVTQYQVTVIDPGAGKNGIALYDKLIFEVSRDMIDRLNAEFRKTPPAK